MMRQPALKLVWIAVAAAAAIGGAQPRTAARSFHLEVEVYPEKLVPEAEAERIMSPSGNAKQDATTKRGLVKAFERAQRGYTFAGKGSLEYSKEGSQVRMPVGILNGGSGIATETHDGRITISKGLANIPTIYNGDRKDFIVTLGDVVCLGGFVPEDAKIQESGSKTIITRLFRERYEEVLVITRSPKETVANFEFRSVGGKFIKHSTYQTDDKGFFTAQPAEVSVVRYGKGRPLRMERYHFQPLKASSPFNALSILDIGEPVIDQRKNSSANYVWSGVLPAVESLKEQQPAEEGASPMSGMLWFSASVLVLSSGFVLLRRRKPGGIQ